MRDILTSPRSALIKRNNRVRNLRLRFLYVFLVLLFIGALAFFSDNSKLTINKIVVTGNRIINTSDVESIAKNKLTGRYLGLFARSNGLIYPNDQIYNALIDAYPRIEILSIDRDDRNTLHVSITERSGLYLYCGDKIPEDEFEIGENCYFINNDGYVFDRAPYFSGNIYFKYYMPITDGGDNPLKKHLLPLDKFHELLRFIEGVSLLGLKPTNLAVDGDGSYSLYLDHILLATNPKIVFKTDDLPTILGNLSVSMKNKEFVNEINSKYDALLYIDLRFKNKVIYKFSTPSTPNEPVTVTQ